MASSSNAMIAVLELRQKVLKIEKKNLNMILKGKSLCCVSFKLVISYNTYLIDKHLIYFPNILISNLQSSFISKRFI